MGQKSASPRVLAGGAQPLCHFGVAWGSPGLRGPLHTLTSSSKFKVGASPGATLHRKAWGQGETLRFLPCDGGIADGLHQVLPAPSAVPLSGSPERFP